MSEHDGQYQKETRELPVDAQLALLKAGWEHGIRGQIEMGFDPQVIATGIIAAALTAFVDDESRAAFLEDLAADYRGRVQQSGPQTIN